MLDEYDFCRSQEQENTDPRKKYAVNYATAGGHLITPSESP